MHNRFSIFPRLACSLAFILCSSIVTSTLEAKPQQASQKSKAATAKKNTKATSRKPVPKGVNKSASKVKAKPIPIPIPPPRIPAAASKMTLGEVLAASPASDWRSIDPENTLYVDFPFGRVVIELAPNFAPKHTANIKTLVREGYFDGLAIMRSQDNYVVQWGDPDEKNPRSMKNGVRSLEEEFTTAMRKELEFTPMPDNDGYARQIGYANGMPAAQDPKTGRAWLAHCYGMVGAGRDVASNSGSGAEIYVVNGHAPRHLDRNVTLLGRVLQGMPLLSSLPRGTGPLGFYEKPEQNIPIKSIKVAADVPTEERVNLEVVKSNSLTFRAATAALRNRGGDWYKVPAGNLELCNVPLMVRAKK